MDLTPPPPPINTASRYVPDNEKLRGKIEKLEAKLSGENLEHSSNLLHARALQPVDPNARVRGEGGDEKPNKQTKTQQVGHYHTTRDNITLHT